MTLAYASSTSFLCSRPSRGVVFLILSFFACLQKMKSQAASAAIKVMNPHIRVTPYEIPVQTEGTLAHYD